MPDPGSRGHLDQLRFEMDTNAVSDALVVCAAIGDNRDNLGDVVADRATDTLPDGAERFHLLADVDCPWHAAHHQAGSADRVRAAAERSDLCGITHYLGETDDGWLDSAEGDAFLRAVAERDLVLSLSASPPWHAAVARSARRHPTLPIALHHLGLARAAVPSGDDVSSVLRLAQVPNVLVKVSGLHYVSARPWAFPYPGSRDLLARLVDGFGPDRLCWGSDFPAARAHVTYRQSLEAIRSEHADLFGTDGLAAVLGGTVASLLATRRPVGH